MRVPALLLSLALLPLAGTAMAQPHYHRAVHIITSDYDLVDTTYIDRGRLDGVRVGDHFHVEFPDGKVVTNVVVTGVFERMSSVKVVDSWLLKNGQIAGYKQRPMVVPFEPVSRRRAPVLADAQHRQRAGRLGLNASVSVQDKGQAPAATAAPSSAAASSGAPMLPPDAGSPAPASGTAPASSAPAGPAKADAALPPPPDDSVPTAAPAQPGSPASAPAAADSSQIPPPPE